MRRILWFAALLALVVGLAWGATNGLVSCTGTGTRPSPNMKLTPAVLAFGSLDSGLVAVNTFTIENVGGGTLRGSVRPRATCGPDFTLLLNESPAAAVPYALQAGQKQVVSVRFAPVRVGPQACDFDVAP